MMKLKPFHFLSIALLSVIFIACSEEAPKDNNALKLYHESSAHLENVFDKAYLVEMAIFNLDSGAVEFELAGLENSVDETLRYLEHNDLGQDSISNLYKMSCLNWASYYGLATAEYEHAFELATTDSMTTEREQEVRMVLKKIADEDAKLKAMFEKERDALLKANNIVLE